MHFEANSEVDVVGLVDGLAAGGMTVEIEAVRLIEILEDHLGMTEDHYRFETTEAGTGTGTDGIEMTLDSEHDVLHHRRDGAGHPTMELVNLGRDFLVSMWTALGGIQEMDLCLLGRQQNL